MHYVYILESVQTPTEKYVGSTGELKSRIAEHNAGKSPHTAKHRPWNLVCYHAFADERRAIAFEKYLKPVPATSFAASILECSLCRMVQRLHPPLNRERG